jgi:hypothetical protein
MTPHLPLPPEWAAEAARLRSVADAAPPADWAASGGLPAVVAAVDVAYSVDG